MRLSHIEIRNFRSFDNEGISIDLPKIDVPISIVGHNNSGKSNFIKAIVNACGYKEYKSVYTIDDFYCQKSDVSAEATVLFSEPIEIPTIYGTDKAKECHGAQLVLSVDGADINGFSYALGSDGKHLRNQEQLRSRSLPTLINKYKEQINLFYIDFQRLETYLKINSYSLLGKVLKDVKSDFKLPENTIKNKSGKEVPREKYFKDILNFIEKELLATEKFNSLVKKVEDITKSQLQLGDKSITLSFNLPESDKMYDSMVFKLSDNPVNKPPLPLSNLGDGFRAMLIIAILRVLINAGEGGKIIILEEPETFLHEHFQEYFYEVLNDLAKTNQVIYTTHSKKFTNIFKPESIIRIKNDNFLKSEIVFKENPKIELPDEINNFKITNPNDFSKYLRTLEPNLGNIIFADKVVIVEGPDDILAYKTLLSEKINFGLQNIALVAAWGKDPIITIVDLCKRFDIPYFVIHDWDLDNNLIDINITPGSSNKNYLSLEADDKTQYTKNNKIYSVVGDIKRIHHNKRNLESVLKIESKDKGVAGVYEKVANKNYDTLIKEFPDLIDQNLIKFLGI